jgi:hypothetical protein
MVDLITSASIDLYVGINEVMVEVQSETKWKGYSEALQEAAIASGDEMVELVDAEGGFVCFCTREMAGFIGAKINT